MGLREEVRLSAGERKTQHLKSGKRARGPQKAFADDVRKTGLPFQREFYSKCRETEAPGPPKLRSGLLSFSCPDPEISPASGTTRHPSRFCCCRRRRRFQQSRQGPTDEAFVVTLRLGAGVLSGVLGRRKEDWNDISISKGRPQRGAEVSRLRFSSPPSGFPPSGSQLPPLPSPPIHT